MRNLGHTVHGGHSGEFAAFLVGGRPMPATVVAANFCCQHLAAHDGTRAPDRLQQQQSYPTGTRLA